MKRRNRDSKLPKILTSFRITAVVSCMAMLISSNVSMTQVISPELRRLAIATNQFGIDSLKALDKIEPPDRVIVFCPVCISSTLMMIMMGSSKYPVVSSLRHALYVWPMRPQEINRGFRDIFDHIGINQRASNSKASHNSEPIHLSESTKHELHPNRTSVGLPKTIDEGIRLHPINRQDELAGVSYAKLRQIAPREYEVVSLPGLIRLKELIERSLNNDYKAPWWHSISRRSDKSRNELGADEARLVKEHKMQPIEVNDPSQMSALSSIYIQRGLSMNYNYNIMLRQFYKTVIHPVDFLHNAEETRKHINSLVAASTENKIKDLVKRRTFETKSAPKIMIISTFHFRGTLDMEMKLKVGGSEVPRLENATRSRGRRSNSNETFQALESENSQGKPAQFIETQPTPLKYGHFSSLDCSVLEIPFSNRLVTLIIVIPDHLNSTDILLTRLSAQVLNDMINSLVVKRLSLGIPVIKFDRGTINMAGLLKELSLDDIFLGDKSYSTETGLNRWLRPSDVIHETSIDIGTLNPDWGQPEDRLKVGAHDSRKSDSNFVKLDKPFFYFVMDSINNLILTMGRIRQ